MVEEEKKPVEPEKNPKDSKKVTTSKYNELLKKYEDLVKTAEEWKNKYYLNLADTENLRKSIDKDHREAIKYRASGFLDKLIPALDGFHMALSMQPKNEEMKAFLQGFSFIYNNIMNALESEGVSEIPTKVGDKFDPSIMHAIDTVEQEGPENVVVNIYGKGYKLHDRLIRPAIVYVSCPIGSKNKEPEKNETSESTIDNMN